jgi:di/tricarboxylate transporter
MVFSTGHYRAMDFVRLGLPITLAYSAVALTVVPYLFPLYP